MKCKQNELRLSEIADRQPYSYESKLSRAEQNLPNKSLITVVSKSLNKFLRRKLPYLMKRYLTNPFQVELIKNKLSLIFLKLPLNIIDRANVRREAL